MCDKEILTPEGSDGALTDDEDEGSEKSYQMEVISLIDKE
jgi:hypothetical protein